MNILTYKDASQPTSRPASHHPVQMKLTVGQPNDAYEQEADQVADRIVSQSTPQQLQKKCAACSNEEKPELQKMEEEEVQTKPISHLQRQATDNNSQQASSAISNQINASRGSGSPMPSPIQQSMESSIGADFSGVRIHTDSRAQNLSAQLNAQAFTAGNDVYFNKGKYNPDSFSGKHLLAHELTHTVQQGASVQRMIQKQEAKTDPLETDEEGYTFGRAPHHHKPGKWAQVQYNASLKCNPSTPDIGSEQRAIECICALSTPAEVMQTVMRTKMAFKPLAAMHLQYYLFGFGGELNEDKNLHDMVLSDDNIKQLISYNIGKGFKANKESGHFMIEQSHYDDDGYKYTFGGIDRVDWEYFADKDEVSIWFKDPYDFHPIYSFYEEMGAGDVFDNGTVRKSNCVHAAAVELLKTGDSKSGAAIFIMKGGITLPLSVFDINASKPNENGAGDISSETSEKGSD